MKSIYGTLKNLQDSWEIARFVILLEKGLRKYTIFDATRI